VDRRLGFHGELSTTAMGIMPHDNVDDALKLALSVDIPFRGTSCQDSLFTRTCTSRPWSISLYSSCIIFSLCFLGLAVGDVGDILTFDVLPLSLFVGGKKFGHCLPA
jgi:hypothetical protein